MALTSPATTCTRRLFIEPYLITISFLRVCVCMCMCVYVCICVCVFACVYLYDVCMPIFLCVWVWGWVYVCVHMDVHMHIFTCKYSCVCAHDLYDRHVFDEKSFFPHVYAYVYVYSVMYMPTHAISAHMHVWMKVCMYIFIWKSKHVLFIHVWINIYRHRLKITAWPTFLQNKQENDRCRTRDWF
jgi:hypothetical protein